MNRRGDQRIEIRLPCRLLFPSIWAGSLDALTGDLHRKGLLVDCQLQPGSVLPAVGDRATVQIELPPSQDFSPKCLRCDATLIRMKQLGHSQYQFGMQIVRLDFEDLLPREFDGEIISYLN